MKKIAIIDNFDSFVYNLVRYVRETGATTVVQRNNAIDFDTLDTCDGILFSPGPGIPDEAGAMKEVIRRYYQSHSLLGICLGHQAIAEVFGATLEHCPNPVHGKASTAILRNPDRLHEGFPAHFQVGRYHSWQVSIPPESPLIPSSFTADGSVMGFHHRDLPVFGLQFHPESVLTPLGRRIIQNWIHHVV